MAKKITSTNTMLIGCLILINRPPKQLNHKTPKGHQRLSKASLTGEGVPEDKSHN